MRSESHRKVKKKTGIGILEKIMISKKKKDLNPQLLANQIKNRNSIISMKIGIGQ